MKRVEVTRYGSTAARDTRALVRVHVDVDGPGINSTAKVTISLDSTVPTNAVLTCRAQDVALVGAAIAEAARAMERWNRASSV